MAYTFESVDYVQYFLNNIENRQFTVIFQKTDGSQRQLKGKLDPNGNSKKENVPIMTDEGWKSFNINRVLLIQEDW